MVHSKHKGDREERAIVDRHRGEGFQCQRTLESGARSDGSHTHDIDLKVNDYIHLKGECKMRKDGFRELYKWIEGNQFLTLRANNKKRLYVIPEEIWFELIGDSQ